MNSCRFLWIIELVDKVVSALHDCMFTNRQEGSTLDEAEVDQEEQQINLNGKQVSTRFF